MEWTTQSEQQQRGSAGAYPNGNGLDSQSTQPLPAAPAGTPAPGNGAALPTPSAHHAPAPQTATSGYDHCPSCGALVNSDQRYCLNCGHRRGEPRLPFMDAVVFMDAMKQPNGAQAAPPPKKQRRISPNAALIAGVGTLLLALGIGVLIGRSGGENTAAPQQAPLVIERGAGTEEASTAATSGAATTSGGGKSTAGKSKKVVKKEKEQAAASGEGAEEFLKPSGNVKLPPAKTGVGDKCEKGTAGCKGEEFTGEFFGE